jgi:hypothetical protein
MRASKLPGIRTGGHFARKPTYAGVAKQCGQSRTLIQWQLTAGQRASPIFIIFVGNTQATDIGGHPSAILEKSKSTDRSLKNDGPDPTQTEPLAKNDDPSAFSDCGRWRLDGRSQNIYHLTFRCPKSISTLTRFGTLDRNSVYDRFSGGGSRF